MSKQETFKIIVEDKQATLRKPRRAEAKIVQSMMMSDPGSYLDAGQILLNSCWLEGDEELKDSKSEDNYEYNFAACRQALQMIQIKLAGLEKI